MRPQRRRALAAAQEAQAAADQDFLDEDEQERLVAEFERDSARAQKLAKTSIALLGGALASLLLIFAALQLLSPWSVRHHAELQGVLLRASVVTGEVGSLLAVATATASVMTYRPDGSAGPEETWRKLLAFSSTGGLFAVAFWVTAVYKVLQKNSFVLGATWRLFWLPLAPGAFVVCAAMVLNSLSSVPPEIARMRARMYRLKRA